MLFCKLQIQTEKHFELQMKNKSKRERKKSSISATNERKIREKKKTFDELSVENQIKHA